MVVVEVVRVPEVVMVVDPVVVRPPNLLAASSAPLVELEVLADQVVELVQKLVVDPSVEVHQKECVVGHPSMTGCRLGRQVVLESTEW